VKITVTPLRKESLSQASYFQPFAPYTGLARRFTLPGLRGAGHRVFLSSGQSGQTLVEFIFVFLILFAIFLAIIHIGFMSISKSMLNLAAYSACREYVVTQNQYKSIQAAQHYFSPIQKQGFAGPLDISFSPDGGFGSKALVVLKSRYNMPGLPGTVTETVFPMESHCVMSME